MSKFNFKSKLIEFISKENSLKVLDLLKENINKEFYINQITRELNLNYSVVRIIRKLEEVGLIERIKLIDNQNKHSIKITNKGIEFLNLAKRSYNKSKKIEKMKNGK